MQIWIRGGIASEISLPRKEAVAYEQKQEKSEARNPQVHLALRISIEILVLPETLSADSEIFRREQRMPLGIVMDHGFDGEVQAPSLIQRRIAFGNTSRMQQDLSGFPPTVFI